MGLGDWLAAAQPSTAPSDPHMRYADVSYAGVAAELHRLSLARPDLARLSTAQKLFGLGTAGECKGTDGKRGPCVVHVLEVTNHSSAAARPGRPQVLISGALHGDERIGPATALALSRWLVRRYDTDAWVRRLVDTRVVLIVPMANAIGVESNTREELGIDPNRDFPYDQAAAACMQTIAARAVNELYRSHLLQLVLTFHGGMQALGYNWGAFPYLRKEHRRSPDDASQRQVAGAVSRFAGSGGLRGGKPYPYAPMSDLVYPDLL